MLAKKGRTIKADGIGRVELDTCILKDVLHVPELTKNLLSVSAITANGGEVIFGGEEVKIKKGNRTLLQGRKNSNGLYEIKLTDRQTFHSEEENKSAKWHRRLGHIGDRRLRKLTQMADGLDLGKDDGKDTLCDVCVRAKQTRKPFGKERSRASRPLEIVHTDVCGPIEPPTWDGNRYYVAFLDDYTHHAMVYFLKRKNEVAEKIQEYVGEVETKWKSKIGKLRCDNGTEYTDERVKTYCKRKGIVLDCTITYTPQHNGRAERLNRTLMEKARAMILDSGLRKEMWGEAVRTAAYIINRSPTESLEVTLYRRWTGKTPDLSNMRIFGSIAYAKKLKPLKKLDERSEKYTMLGYCPNGYRLWDEQKRKIILRRDVIFNERRKTADRNREQTA